MIHILEKDYSADLEPIFNIGAIQKRFWFPPSPYPPAYQR